MRGSVLRGENVSTARDKRRARSETIERDSHIGGGMLAGALSYRLYLFVLPLAFFIALVIRSAREWAGYVVRSDGDALRGPALGRNVRRKVLCK
jgi:hypothetical protein